MLLGSDIYAFLAAVVSMRPDVIGLNCSTGPDEMAQLVKELLRLSPLPVAILPNAGMPKNIDGEAHYDMSPEAFAEIMIPLVTGHGLNVVGGCCGTTPDHIRTLAEGLVNVKAASRDVSTKRCFLGTGISGTDLERVHRPIIIGERLNTQGSRKTKELVLSGNYDELYHIALQQSEKGSHLLDICTAMNERDNETESNRSLVSYLSDRTGVPFCIDSTEIAVMESSLRVCPGTAMLNSINIEQGGRKARQLLKLALQFGSPVIALTIDDRGMAKTASEKLETAQRIYTIACEELGLPPHYLYIDPLVFTIATGDSESAGAAKESLEAIRSIKTNLPEVRTVMGVSNVSFGLSPKARRILNNCMLYYAVRVGLDAAIFNPLHLDDYEKYDEKIRTLAENVLFNRSENALSNYIGYFEQVKEVHTGSGGGSKNSEALSDEDRLRNAVLRRDRRELAPIIGELLKTKSGTDILNGILLPAMSEVGERMARGEMILPFVLQAAEIMKEAVQLLEPHMKNVAASKQGKIILATVYGDIHDIGKNLVGSILQNQGYEVIDLGKQVPLETIVETVKKEQPDAIGLSALLVTTSRHMVKCVREFDRLGFTIPIIIGGAAVNRDYAARIAAGDDGRVYEGGVYYAKDAFEATKILESLGTSGKTTEPTGRTSESAVTHRKEDEREGCHEQPEPLEYSYIEPPFYGTSEILVWDSASLLDSISTIRLFKAWWGGGKLSAEEYRKAEEQEFKPAFDLIRNEIIENSIVDARGYYGFFPIITDGEMVIMLDPADFHTEISSFRFPRMEKRHCRSLADYLRPEGDILALQIVTIGKRLGDRCREFFTEDKYQLGYMLNGLGNYLVEYLAQRLTNEIQRAMGIPADFGKRYSFGYPGLPGLDEQAKLFPLLGIEERLGVTLTPGLQMDPEHSTLGIFVHHPNAVYFI